jgi:anti-anti-sigma factor
MSYFPLEREGANVNVMLGAELTASSVPELRNLLCAIQDDGVQELVLDCCETTLVDAAGLGLLLAARKGFGQEGRTLKLVHVQPSVFSLLQTLRLDRRLNAEMG